jgi:nucleoid DNA-binding protein
MDTKGIIDILSDRCNVDKETSASILNSLSQVIGDSACEMDSIAVPGFGTFEPKKRLERINVHPATGKRMLLPPKIFLTFRPSVLLKQKINNTK